MIVLHASFPIDPEHREEALVEESNEEPGTVEYRAAVDVDDETVLRFFERYEDEPAFEAHAGSAHFQEFEARLPEILAGEPTVTQFEVSDATELDL
ncbi:putative quinol monooxygenase [Halobellus salinisoli]|uniref:putative quinol monooxygenase n=1 Tax=Halobellus salinisoli TaxID=3108500 RepID=UPI00300A16D9